MLVRPLPLDPGAVSASERSQSQGLSACLPACLLELLLSGGSKEGPNSLAPRSLKQAGKPGPPWVKIKAACMWLRHYFQFPGRRTGMTKGAPREPHSLVEAHRPPSSEQRRTENRECFPSGKNSSPFHRLLKMNFPHNSG